MTPGLAIGLALAPWVLLGAFLALGIRDPRPLPAWRRDADAEPPFVSVIVPARNEARNIAACLESLAAQEYPAFEIIVVDDRSDDGTGERARAVEPGNARELRVVSGRPRPDDGWFGKPWACVQGAKEARGELLLFTDADTRHAPDLLGRALAGLREDGAAALSALGRQEMRGFWERLVQPHVFLLLGMRYRRLDRPIDPDREDDAILNGQHILVARSVYEAVGGHEAVKGEVVEDLRLAQELVRGGHRITLRGAEESLTTRMYESLGGIMEGWTKNLAVGARQSAGWWGRAAVPAIVAFLLAAWVVPVAVLVVAGAGALFRGLAGAPGGAEALLGGTGGSLLLAWAAGVVLLNLVLWIGAYRRFGAPLPYAFLHPLGAALVALIALRSGVRGEARIEWKGRRYSAAKGGGGS